MEINGTILTLKKEEAGPRQIDEAIKKADLFPAGLSQDKDEVRIICHLGSEKRLERVAALLRGEE